MKKQSIIAFMLLTQVGYTQDNTLALDTTKSNRAQNEKLSQIYVQASMSDLLIEEQSKSISLIRKEDILRYVGTGSIQGLLEESPGILYSRSGGINGQITIRGMNSQYTRSIITFDGVRVTGRNTLELNLVDPNAIEEIEIIRGPASSLYGSDAMNGVVNFKTRRYRGDVRQPFSADAKIRALEYSSINQAFGGRIEVLGGGNGYDMLVGFGGRKGDDYRTPKGIAKNSGFESYGLDFNVGYTGSNDVRYYTQGRYQHTTTHRAGGFGAAPGSAAGIFLSEDPIVEYYLRGGVEAYDLGFADKMDSYVYWRHYDTDIFNNRLAFNGLYIHQKVYNNNYVGGKIGFDKKIGEHALAYGIDILSSISPTQVKQYVGDPIVSERYSNRSSNSNDIGVYVKDDWSVLDSLILSGSLRGDYIIQTIGNKRYHNETAQDSEILDNSGVMTEGAFTGSIGGIYFLTDSISSFVNLSRNFKAPGTGYMMQTTPGGDSTNPTIANTNLKSEYSHTAEIGLRLSTDNHFVSLAGYFTRYTDMIALSTLQQNSYRQYVNIGKVDIMGAELQGNHQFDSLKISYNATYTYGQDKANDVPLSYIAPLYGRVNVEYAFDFGFIKLTERAYKGKTRINPSEEKKTKSYAMTDVYLGFDLGYFNKQLKDMELVFGVENVFNKVGVNPVTVQTIALAYDGLLTNPLIEPGRNFMVKYAYKY